ncbi:MAG: D-glutamate deacylase, partial [Akkermansiaceae bacterium]|nr:D-glutamate deacylase [Akkermansiaceae bacterium]
APGFIDLHEHGHDPESYELQVLDGVTTSLELELGSTEVADWYEERKNQTLLNYGVSAGHARVRMKVMKDLGP